MERTEFRSALKALGGSVMPWLATLSLSAALAQGSQEASLDFRHIGLYCIGVFIISYIALRLAFRMWRKTVVRPHRNRVEAMTMSFMFFDTMPNSTS